MAKLLQKQEILPASLAAPSFVCVDVVGTEHDISQRSVCPAYGSICGACGKENHWRKVCRASKFSKRQQNSSGGRQRHSKAPKGKPSTEKHLHSLEAHNEVQDSPDVSLPDQLYFHTLSINQVTKCDTQAFLEVEVESDQGMKPLLCKVDTGAEGNHNTQELPLQVLSIR